MAKLDIYTDASVKGENIRIGALVIDENEKEYELSKGINIYFTDHDTSSVIVTAELYAIYFILNHFKNHTVNITIYTDNMVAFEHLNKCVKEKKKHEKRYVQNQLLGDIFDIISNVDIRWIKGHSHVYGNHIADKLAKQKKDISLIYA